MDTQIAAVKGGEIETRKDSRQKQKGRDGP